MVPTRTRCCDDLFHSAAIAPHSTQAAEASGEDVLLWTLASRHVSLFDVSIGRTNGGAMVEYRGNLRIRRPDRLSDLADHIADVPGLVEFDFARVGKCTGGDTWPFMLNVMPMTYERTTRDSEAMLTSP